MLCGRRLFAITALSRRFGCERQISAASSRRCQNFSDRPGPRGTRCSPARHSEGRSRRRADRFRRPHSVGRMRNRQNSPAGIGRRRRDPPMCSSPVRFSNRRKRSRGCCHLNPVQIPKRRRLRQGAHARCRHSRLRQGSRLRTCPVASQSGSNRAGFPPSGWRPYRCGK